MKRFILTGAPGAGKTAILRQLELEGYNIVEEAATDIIALWQAKGTTEPWTHPAFIDAVVELQRLRLQHASLQAHPVQFHDRSVICTAALANYLEIPASPLLRQELERVRSNAVFEEQVLFIRSLGFITPTEARRISYEESLRFEEIHLRAYLDHGYKPVFIERAPLADRVAAVLETIRDANDD